MKKQDLQIINYVWINQFIFPPKSAYDESPLCGIKLHEVERALSNAKKYPNAQFKIWIDWRYLDVMSRFFLESQVYFSGCDNIKIHSLQEIPEYQKNPSFKTSSGTQLWCKVDYARLLVLNHVLDYNKDASVYYSDMDCEDLMLDDDDCQTSMEDDGILMAKVKNTPYENGFFGFTKKGQYFLDALKKETHKTTKDNMTGYLALGKIIKKLFPHGSHERLCKVKLERSRVNMKKPEYYSKHNIC